MGLFRFLFALTVVATHSGPIFGILFTGGNIAVESFFMISGFYMALILNEKYIGKNDSYMLFITNRLLRIYPMYWAILFLTIILSLYWESIGLENKIHPYFEYLKIMDSKTILYLIFTNLFIFGQDIIMFLGMNNQNGELHFVKYFFETKPQMYIFLLIPQGWTLALELSFYIIAPFLVRRKLWIILLGMSISLFLRIGLHMADYIYDPWILRFFPTELIFFLGGVVSYKIYEKIKKKKLNRKVFMYWYIFMIAYTCFYFFLPNIPFYDFTFAQIMYYILFLFFIPFCFYFSKENKLDNYIGLLSYPMYISHSLIINAMFNYNVWSFYNNFFFGAVAAIFTVIFSALMIRLIEVPVDTYRNRRIKGKVKI